jgi:transcriptional regulator GlxA family with amidase domain
MRNRSAGRYREIIERFDRIARANLESFASVADLCRGAQIPHHTLLRALRAIHATSPVRYLHELRLSEARRALISRNCAVKNVTEVATRFGFRELGRFSGEYRDRFGESPSDTLRRSCRSG